MTRYFALCAAYLLLLPAGAAAQNRKPCPTIVGIWSTAFEYKQPQSSAPRVEARQCDSDGTDTIQLVAWKDGASEPTLVLDTGDFGITAAFYRGNVFVIETGGATRFQVYVIVYHRGVPKLELSRVTKGHAEVNADSKFVRVAIDKSDGREHHRFMLKNE